MRRVCDSSTAGANDGSSPKGEHPLGQPRVSPSDAGGGQQSPKQRVQQLSQNGLSLSLSVAFRLGLQHGMVSLEALPLSSSSSLALLVQAHHAACNHCEPDSRPHRAQALVDSRLQLD